MPKGSATAMQRITEGGARAVVTAVLERTPLPRGDTMIARIGEFIAALARESDVRRALKRIGLSAGTRAGTRIADVASVAEAFDASTEQRSDAGELALRALLEALLEAPDAAILPAFVARLTERWVLSQLGHAPSDHFESLEEHARFRADVGAVVRAAAERLASADVATALAALQAVLSGGPS